MVTLCKPVKDSIKRVMLLLEANVDNIPEEQQSTIRHDSGIIKRFIDEEFEEQKKNIASLGHGDVVSAENGLSPSIGKVMGNNGTHITWQCLDENHPLCWSYEECCLWGMMVVGRYGEGGVRYININLEE